MDELYNPFPKLPKNIRQIGERDEIVKLYVEDYVNTYLKRLFPVSGQRLRVGLLLGSLELSEGTPYIFIDGALEMEDVTEEGLKVSFTELSWKRASQNMDQLFPKRSIQGWFICGSPGEDLSPLNYWKQHMQYFGGPNKLMYLSCGTEGDETIYVTSEDGFYKLQGYSIYYERNQMMQDYMVLRKDVKRIETDTNDKVIEEFRKRMGENKEEAVDRHQTVGLLRGMCMAMSVVVLAGGIVMFNNYERMKSMESVVVSAIPAKAEKILLGDKAQQKGEKKESGVVVEEADGEVYPTSAVNKETMSETMPGTEQAQTAAQAGETAGETVSETAAAAETEPATQKVVEEKVTQAAKPETQPATQAAATDGQRIHTVVEGETLYGICIAEYKSVNKLKEICELNGLEDENKIVAGQKLRLP
ncbi:LysM domain-containing protein [Lacrimispora xylanisolvens]|uniref:LysM domain-containing protein n=1 Tax=Lacrimispora xylanisolvens TaxID=384636 RepID=A0A2S6HEI8_9FIRM|nr:LysM peptidoglycan-binding domain-containing protein [Hungatella xylanolytica]PPK75887.1 LysM domain-containing protein [Hungatella xylanolytica]